MDGGLTVGVDIGDGGALGVGQLVAQLGGASQGVDGGGDGRGDLLHGLAVGRGGVDDLVQQGAHGGRVVALSVTDLAGSLAEGGVLQQTLAACSVSSSLSGHML